MAFYTDISPYYDLIFPVNAGEMAFAARLLEGRRRILDIGCGTGNKTVLFKQPENEIVGVDADAGMIEKARQDNAAAGVSYEVMDMQAADAAFAAGTFDAALCLGNSLVHIPNVEGIRHMLSGTARILRGGGLLLLQILNYDRILDNNVTALPTLETEDVRFCRSYALSKGEALFTTELLVKKSGERYANEVPLYPLRKEELSEALAGAGFSSVAYFGSYEGDALTPDSFVLIAAAYI